MTKKSMIVVSLLVLGAAGMIGAEGEKQMGPDHTIGDQKGQPTELSKDQLAAFIQELQKKREEECERIQQQALKDAKAAAEQATTDRERREADEAERSSRVYLRR